jgi:hypothetical protein
MVRRFSLWCTAFILLTALASLGIAGCGGGSGGSGVSSQDLFGNLTVRVTREEGPTRVQVQGETILLATSSSAQRLLVELFPLPLQTPPTPLMARSFDLVDGRGQVVIDQIPAPARYQVRGYLYEGANAEYSASFLVEDIEILPGVVASASTWLTPRPSVSPTVSPSPSPSVSPSPGVLFPVGSSALPGLQPHVAMRGDGRFVVSWRHADGVFAQGFSPDASPSPLWNEQPVSIFGSVFTYSDPAPAIHPTANLFGVAWVQSLSGSSQVLTGYRNLLDGSSAGPLADFPDPTTDVLSSTGFGMPENLGDPTPLPVVNYQQTSTGSNTIQSYLVPSDDPTVAISRGEIPFARAPVLDVDANGDCAEVFQDSDGQLICLVSDNNRTNSSPPLVVASSVLGMERPSVAIRNGRIAVAWLGYTESGMTIFVQRFQYTPGASTLTLVPLDSGPINLTSDLPGDSHMDPDVAMDGEGNCVVVWRSWEDPSAGQIVGRPVNSDGSLQGRFVASVDDLVEHAWPSVGMDSAGNYVVCWGVSSGGPIQGRRYPSSFAPGVGI